MPRVCGAVAALLQLSAEQWGDRPMSKLPFNSTRIYYLDSCRAFAACLFYYYSRMQARVRACARCGVLRAMQLKASYTSFVRPRALLAQSLIP